MAFPWEFVLSAATKKGRAETLLVTRLLPRNWPKAPTQLDKLLFVQSAPGRLDGFYSFDPERARLRAATGQKRWTVSDSDSLDRLQARILKHKPNVMHVSAIDNHQAAQIIPGFYAEKVLAEDLPQGPEDGMVVRRAVDTANDPRSLPQEEPIPYDEVAKHLVPSGLTPKPWLVTCNLYYSSARIAPECIRRGAAAAVGFQDEVDDELAELFFQEFYRAWDGNHAAGLPRAFGRAWEALYTHRQQLYGTGIVLWLARSAFDGKRQPALGLAAEVDAPVPKLATAQQRKETRTRPIAEVLQVEFKVPASVNYSLLHNARPFLQKFTLNKLVAHTLDEIAVVVDLNVGDGSLPVPLHRAAARLVSARRLRPGQGPAHCAAPQVAARASADDALCQGVLGPARRLREHPQRHPAAGGRVARRHQREPVAAVVRVAARPGGDAHHHRRAPASRDAARRPDGRLRRLSVRLRRRRSAARECGHAGAGNLGGARQRVQAALHQPAPGLLEAVATTADAVGDPGLGLGHVHRPGFAARGLPRIHRHLSGGGAAQRPCLRRLLAQLRRSRAVSCRQRGADFAHDPHRRPLALVGAVARRRLRVASGGAAVRRRSSTTCGRAGCASSKPPACVPGTRLPTR